MASSLASHSHHFFLHHRLNGGEPSPFLLPCHRLPHLPVIPAHGRGARANGGGTGSDGGRGRGGGGGGTRRWKRQEVSDGGRRRSMAKYRPPKKGMHPAAFEVEDEETGGKVIVWGVDGLDPPEVKSQDLKWTYAREVVPGEGTEDTWYRAFQGEEGEEDDDDGGDSNDNDGREDIVASYSEDDTPVVRRQPRQSNNAGSKVGSGSLFSKLKVQSLRARARGDEGIGRKNIPSDTSRSFGKEALPTGRRKERSLPSLQKSSDQFNTKTFNEIGFPERGRAFSPPAWKDALPDLRKSEDFFSAKTFKGIGASEEIVKALSSMHVKRPSQIQAMSYSNVLEGQSCIIADQTGSGKTLAYLAPLIQRLHKEEMNGSSRPLPNRPRALIIVPTSELAAQVLLVCRGISREVPCKSLVATGGFKLKTQVESLNDRADVLIATPGRLSQLLDSGSLLLDHLLCLVIDEVDILFDDEDFSGVLTRISSFLSPEIQCIHVTATLPNDIYTDVIEKYPDSVSLMGPGLHRTASTLEEVLVDCSGEGEKNPETAFENKKKALVELAEQQPVSKTIVFCNKIETCRMVENVLKRSDKKGSKSMVLPYHAALSLEVRLENMKRFSEPKPEIPLFLVCTDRASRGLDLVGVEHVILFDYPRDPSEYVRRVGRTARAGCQGKAFVFVVGKQVALAKRTMMRNEKGHPLYTLPCTSF